MGLQTCWEGMDEKPSALLEFVSRFQETDCCTSEIDWIVFLSFWQEMFSSLHNLLPVLVGWLDNKTFCKTQRQVLSPVKPS